MAICTVATMHAVVHQRHPLHHVRPPRRRVRLIRATAGAAAKTSSWEADTLSKAFWDYNVLFRSQRAETSDPVQLRVIEGAIPPDFPAGTYYLAGPGMFSDDHGSTVHPLDGHGYLRSFRFSPDHGVRYSARSVISRVAYFHFASTINNMTVYEAIAMCVCCRYVETAAKAEEKRGASWRFTHRGPFSVLQGGQRVGNVKVMKNVANTSVLWWGGKLLCLWEGGTPYELDPRTLRTVGPFDLLGLADRAAGRRWSGRCRPWLQEAALDVATRLLRPVLSGA